MAEKKKRATEKELALNTAHFANVMKTKIYYKITMREYYKLAVDKEHKCVVAV